MARRNNNKSYQKGKNQGNKAFKPAKTGKPMKAEQHAAFMEKQEGRKFPVVTDRPTNDVNWYVYSEQALRDCASISYANLAGMPLNFTSNVRPTVPGIVTMHLTPSVGFSNDNLSALNLAKTGLYSYVRHENSGHANYDPSDLMIMVLGMGQAYSYLNYLQRVYGLATLYAQKNRYMPKGLLKAQWIDADDVANHLADFRYGINMRIKRIGSLSVPAEISLFKRWAYIYSNVYQESESIKDQLYMYIPDGFYQYAVSDSDYKGRLNYKKVYELMEIEPNELKGYEDLLRGLDNLLDPLLNAEDIGIMFGDLLKAYGPEKMIQVQEIPSDYTIAPLVDRAVLEQFQNATVWPYVVPNIELTIGTATCDITQTNDGTLLSNIIVTGYPHSYSTADVDTMEFKLLQSYLDYNHIMNTYSPEGTPAITMENSRLQSFGTFYLDPAAGKSHVKITSCGSEVASELRVYYANWASGTPEFQFNIVSPVVEWIKSNTSSQELSNHTNSVITELANRRSFHYMPVQHLFNSTGSVAAPSFTHLGCMFETDNYVIVDKETVDKMHNIAILTELNVPSIGFYK